MSTYNQGNAAYIAPQMEIIDLQIESNILEGSISSTSVEQSFSFGDNKVQDGGSI